MKNKIFNLFLIVVCLIFIFAFVSCGDDETSSSIENTESSSMKNTETSTDESTETTSTKVMYNVTYDFANGEENVTEEFEENSKIEKKLPKKNGYTFIEWQSEGRAWNFDNDTLTKNITLTAIWEKATLGEIEYNAEKLAISVNDEITPELFGAKCFYSNGDSAEITVKLNGEQAARKTVSVELSVKDGEVIKSATIENIKVYGMPSLTYNSNIEWVNVKDGLTKSYFFASGMDSFGKSTEIKVYIEGEYEVGKEGTITIASSDEAGNVKLGYVENVKLYDNPVITYNKEKSSVNLTDTIDATLFESIAKDSFGNVCDVVVESKDILVQGSTTTIIFKAVDEKGNASILEVNDIKVYGTPKIQINEFLNSDTDISTIATVTDSFGAKVDAEITHTGDLTDGSHVSIVVKATDSKGNKLEKTYKYVVNHNSHTYTDGICSVCEKKEPSYVRDGDYIYFGEFPQTIKADDVTITETVNEKGYYLGSDGEWYAKVDDPFLFNGYIELSSGKTIVSYDEYYFKVEPIKWRILTENDGKALILCENVIYGSMYAPSTNIYSKSLIREWLNAEFYNTAFDDLQKEVIAITKVDNSPKSSGYEENVYSCEDTEDKLFLLSAQEAFTVGYGFDSDESRIKRVSDYALMFNLDTTEEGDCYWRLRSSADYTPFGTRRITYTGELQNFAIMNNDGIVPALVIELD